ncbi:PTS system cellobiose-specific IIA component [Bacillus sp. V2I10]|nr:PTS system cellobiose-specific IIA component [Bacillus sp. V2I10]
MTASISIEQTAFQIILHSGNARSSLIEAMQYAREGNFEEAEACFELAKKELTEAHHSQTGLIQEEARGQKAEVSILLVHAQDHLMNTITVRELTHEIIYLHKKIEEKN